MEAIAVNGALLVAEFAAGAFGSAKISSIA
jgi:hypothetical protein